MDASTTVVGVGPTPTSMRAAEWAAQRAASTAGDVLLVHVEEEPAHAWTGDGPAVPHVPLSAGVVDELLEPVCSRSLLAVTAQRLRETSPAVSLESRSLRGDAADALLAQSHDAGVVVVGLPRHRHLRWRTSTCRHLLQRSTVPVVVVPSTARTEGPVVVGVDDSGAGRAAVRFAAAEARLRGARSSRCGPGASATSGTATSRPWTRSSTPCCSSPA